MISLTSSKVNFIDLGYKGQKCQISHFRPTVRKWGQCSTVWAILATWWSFIFHCSQEDFLSFQLFIVIISTTQMNLILPGPTYYYTFTNARYNLLVFFSVFFIHCPIRKIFIWLQPWGLSEDECVAICASFVTSLTSQTWPPKNYCTSCSYGISTGTQ